MDITNHPMSRWLSSRDCEIYIAAYLDDARDAYDFDDEHFMPSQRVVNRVSGDIYEVSVYTKGWEDPIFTFYVLQAGDRHLPFCAGLPAYEQRQHPEIPPPVDLKDLAVKSRLLSIGMNRSNVPGTVTLAYKTYCEEYQGQLIGFINDEWITLIFRGGHDRLFSVTLGISNQKSMEMEETDLD